jgi:hypothetical protein
MALSTSLHGTCSVEIIFSIDTRIERLGALPEPQFRSLFASFDLPCFGSDFFAWKLDPHAPSGSSLYLGSSFGTRLLTWYLGSSS